jgi:hypothetical protein
VSMNAAMTGAESHGALGDLEERPEAQSVEHDLFALNVMAPELVEHVPALFEEAVKDSLSYMLGSKESARVLSCFRANELESRQGVFERLLVVYGGKASPIQNMIDRVFGMRVHDLVRKLP